MKLLLMCDGVVGCAIASWLVDTYPEDVGLLVTISNNNLTESALKNNIPTMIYQSESQILAFEQGACFTLGILAWWPKIISTALIAKCESGVINTHPSLLPHNRGKHYNFWAIVEGSPFGVSLHFVDEGIDTGDVIAQQEIEYGWQDTGKSLYEKASEAMIELFRLTYPQIRSGNFKRRPQPTDTGSFHYASEIHSASKINLDEKYTARDLINLIRARTFEGKPACRFEEDGIEYEITSRIKRMNHE